MLFQDRLRRLDHRVLGAVPTAGSAEERRRRQSLYLTVAVLIAAVVVYLGVSGEGWLTFFTEDPRWWLVLLPCLVVGAVRLTRSRRR